MTRLKDNADYKVVEERELPQRKGLRRDQVIFFDKLAQAGVDCFLQQMQLYRSFGAPKLRPIKHRRAQGDHRGCRSIWNSQTERLPTLVLRAP